MNLHKSINDIFTVFLSLLTIFIVFSILFSNERYFFYLVLIGLFLSLSPFAYYVLFVKKNKIVSIFILYYGVLLSLFLASFRFIRDTLPYPPVSSKGIIGYSQYFGYPIYLDIIIFGIFLLSPLCLLILVKVITKRKKVYELS